MAKKRKTKKSTVKRSKKRSTRDVDVFTSDVSDESLERAAVRAFTTITAEGGTVMSCNTCVIVGNRQVLISITPNKKAPDIADEELERAAGSARVSVIPGKCPIP